MGVEVSEPPEWIEVIREESVNPEGRRICKRFRCKRCGAEWDEYAIMKHSRECISLLEAEIGVDTAWEGLKISKEEGSRICKRCGRRGVRRNGNTCVYCHARN